MEGPHFLLKRKGVSWRGRWGGAVDSPLPLFPVLPLVAVTAAAPPLFSVGSRPIWCSLGRVKQGKGAPL